MQTRRPAISVDDVIARVQAQVGRLRATDQSVDNEATPLQEPAPAPGLSTAAKPDPRVPLRLQPEFEPRSDGVYALHELADYDDVAFVVNAYRALLERPPDPVGMVHYLDQLRQGRTNKVDILGRLRWSPEGRTRSIKVKGLLPRFALQRAYRLPVLGYVLHWFVALVQLPRVVSHQRHFETYSISLHQRVATEVDARSEQTDSIGAYARAAADGLLQQETRSHVLEESLAALRTTLAADARARADELSDLVGRVRQIQERLGAGDERARAGGSTGFVRVTGHPGSGAGLGSRGASPSARGASRRRIRCP